MPSPGQNGLEIKKGSTVEELGGFFKRKMGVGKGEK